LIYYYNLYSNVRGRQTVNNREILLAGHDNKIKQEILGRREPMWEIYSR
jgi:hypothetical protein